MTDLSRIKPKLRTEGSVSGNFGRAKVKAGSRLNDLGVTSKEVVLISSRDDYVRRMLTLYNDPPSASMYRFALDELRRLGCVQERRIAPSQGDPYRPAGT